MDILHFDGVGSIFFDLRARKIKHFASYFPFLFFTMPKAMKAMKKAKKAAAPAPAMKVMKAMK